jgi:hypothetical protein
LLLTCFLFTSLLMYNLFPFIYSTARMVGHGGPCL